MENENEGLFDNVGDERTHPHGYSSENLYGDLASDIRVRHFEVPNEEQHGINFIDHEEWHWTRIIDFDVPLTRMSGMHMDMDLVDNPDRIRSQRKMEEEPIENDGLFAGVKSIRSGCKTMIGTDGSVRPSTPTEGYVERMLEHYIQQNEEG